VGHGVGHPAPAGWRGSRTGRNAWHATLRVPCGESVTDRPRGATLRRLRAQVLARDGYVCGRCGGAIPPGASPMTPLGVTLGHVVPHAQGGPDTLGNLRPEHRACNLGQRYSTALVAPLARVQRSDGSGRTNHVNVLVVGGPRTNGHSCGGSF